LVEYTIIDVIPLGPQNGKFVLAEVHAARSRDFGSNDTIFVSRTHLGHLLKPGDTAVGYDLATASFNDSDLVALKGKHLPDFILVKKTYPGWRMKNKQRQWKMKSLDKEIDEDSRYDPEKAARDYEGFVRDLEEDPELRSQVNLYKEKNAENIVTFYKKQQEEEMEADEEFPEVALEELLEDLTLEEKDE